MTGQTHLILAMRRGRRRGRLTGIGRGLAVRLALLMLAMSLVSSCATRVAAEPAHRAQPHAILPTATPTTWRPGFLRFIPQRPVLAPLPAAAGSVSPVATPPASSALPPAIGVAKNVTASLALTGSQSITVLLEATVPAQANVAIAQAASPLRLPTPTPASPVPAAQLLPTPTLPLFTPTPTSPPLAPLPTSPMPTPTATSAIEPTPDAVVRTARVPILMYHYLSTPPPDADIYRSDLSVTPELFAAHLDAMLANGYTAISLVDLLAHLTRGAPLPEKPVVITFDDGYRDNFENALPLLQERGMAATFFVVTDFVDEAQPGYLTWEMVRALHAAGMSIESHGRNHVSLKNQEADYLVWQALGSFEAIERELGVRPRFVSYPAGEYDQRTVDIFRSANYWAGFTTVQGATHRSDDLFQLHRVRVRGTTTPEELLRVLALDW